MGGLKEQARFTERIGGFGRLIRSMGGGGRGWRTLFPNPQDWGLFLTAQHPLGPDKQPPPIPQASPSHKLLPWLLALVNTGKIGTRSILWDEVWWWGGRGGGRAGSSEAGEE